MAPFGSQCRVVRPALLAVLLAVGQLAPAAAVGREGRTARGAAEVLADGTARAVELAPDGRAADRQSRGSGLLRRESAPSSLEAASQEQQHPARAADDMFDCYEGLNEWKFGWSAAKCQWCCHAHQIACHEVSEEHHETTTTTVPCTTLDCKPHHAPTGEDVCEGQGWSKHACLSLGCCYFDNATSACFSAVGEQPCSITQIVPPSIQDRLQQRLREGPHPEDDVTVDQVLQNKHKEQNEEAEHEDHEDHEDHEHEEEEHDHEHEGNEEREGEAAHVIAVPVPAPAPVVVVVATPAPSGEPEGETAHSATVPEGSGTQSGEHAGQEEPEGSEESEGETSVNVTVPEGNGSRVVVVPIPAPLAPTPPTPHVQVVVVPAPSGEPEGQEEHEGNEEPAAPTGGQTVIIVPPAGGPTPGPAPPPPAPIVIVPPAPETEPPTPAPPPPAPIVIVPPKPETEAPTPAPPPPAPIVIVPPTPETDAPTPAPPPPAPIVIVPPAPKQAEVPSPTPSATTPTPTPPGPTENKGNTVITFFIDAGEFDESYEAIPKKLRAGGLDMKTFDSKCLSFVTASGGALDGLPEPSDFPLTFTYTPCATAAGAANTPKGEDPAEKPDEQWYDATREDVDFAALAEHVYHKEGGYLPDGWTVSEHIELPSKWWQFYVKATDRVALYRKDSTCVLAFSGSDMNDIGDWLNNANGFFTTKYCGKSGYHRGFVDETDDVLDWEEFFRIMPQVEACASLGRLVITGHSLGGAMATNFAECVNSNVPSSDKHPILRSFPQREVELWTFGAPGTRRGIAASNDRASDGVFKGRRFFSYSAPFCASRHCSPWCCWVQNSWRMQDPIPWLAYNMGFWHPKIVAVGLDSSGKKVEDWKATNERAYREPDTMPLTINPFNKKQTMALTREHSLTETYKPRLEKILALSR